MNTFFRQKLTNKTIDLLEKVEDRKTREEEEDCLILESPTILAIISLPALIILGIIVPDHCHPRGGLYMGNNRYDHIWWNVQLADRIFLILESCDRS